MASFDLPEIPQPHVSPALLVGVASPLWTYFGAAAAGGMACWWMMQWTRPLNLEAMFEAMVTQVSSPDPVSGSCFETRKAIVNAAPEAAPLALGGESGPISPVLQAALGATAGRKPAPEAPPEPDNDEPGSAAARPNGQPPPKSRAKKKRSSPSKADA